MLEILLLNIITIICFLIFKATQKKLRGDALCVLTISIMSHI